MYTSVGVCMNIITCALIVTDSVYVDLREKEEKSDICEIRLHFSVCAHTEYDKIFIQQKHTNTCIFCYVLP